MRRRIALIIIVILWIALFSYNVMAITDNAEIIDLNNSNTDVAMSELSPKQSDKELTPKLLVKCNGKELIEGQDYTVKYKKRAKKDIKNGSLGPRIIIKGKGLYKKALEYSYELDRTNIYVSANGNDQATGDIYHPLKTVQRALYATRPGSTVWLKEGIYKGNNIFTQSGSEADGYITIRPFENEEVTLTNKKGKKGAIFSTEGNSYIKIQKLKIANMKAKDVYGVLMLGGESHIYIEDCEFSNIATSKPGSKKRPGGNANAILLLGEGENKDQSINNIYITGNKVHDNVNGWSENISIAGNCENIYVYNNEVFNNTNIGIDFYGNAEYCNSKEFDQPRNCECIGNTVYNCKSFYAENAGIYVDGARDILVSGNSVYKNSYGIEIGSEEWRDFYDENNQVKNIQVIDNRISENSECGLRLGGFTNDETTGVVTSCLIEGNSFANNGSDNTEIILSKCNNIVFKNNSFQNGLGYESVVKYDDCIDRNKISNILFQ